MRSLRRKVLPVELKQFTFLEEDGSITAEIVPAIAWTKIIRQLKRREKLRRMQAIELAAWINA
jgi:hypothetical protein